MPSEENDPVNHPKHYTSHPSGIECIEVVRHMNFNIGSAVKNLWRHGKKNPEATIEDLQKAIFYIQDEIQKLGGASSGANKALHSSMFICGCKVVFLEEREVGRILCKAHLKGPSEPPEGSPIHTCVECHIEFQVPHEIDTEGAMCTPCWRKMVKSYHP